MPDTDDHDVVLIGAGIMSTTLGVLLARLQPDWRITVVERLPDAGLESSHAWNNAGTGHAGLCEFNYTPRRPDGSVDPEGALRIAEQFRTSLCFWAQLVEEGLLDSPGDFVRSVPHLGFGRGAEGVAYLRARFEAVRGHPLFADLAFSDDRAVLASWLPLVFRDRSAREPVAATRSAQGTDVDFGVLARGLLAALRRQGATVRLNHEVQALHRHGERWHLAVRDRVTDRRRGLRARFVFVGAGGATLPLLQSARVPEVRGLGAFPISGRFLRASRPELVAAHAAKLYGHAAPGAPALSVPHLDRRVVDGQEHLLFGPFAAFSPRFLREGRLTDLVRSVRVDNLSTLAASARDNRDLMAYLLRQLTQSPADRLAALREFVPTARAEDWELVTAGQRVQLLKTVGGRGTMVGYGAETLVSAGGSLAALLGASPGASASASAMIDVLATCFPERMSDWGPRLREVAPSASPVLGSDQASAAERLAQARRTLGLVPVSAVPAEDDPARRGCPAPGRGPVARRDDPAHRSESPVSNAVDRDLLVRLHEAVGSAGLVTDPDRMRGHLTDWRDAYRGRAAAVVRPGSAEEVSRVVGLCHRAGVAVVPQGGNTGLCGGSVPDSSGAQIALSLTRLRRVREVDPANQTITVEAGVVLENVQRAAREAGLLFPLSLGAQGSCTIGGNLATNAGGTAVLRYGTMRDLTLGLEVVLPDGRVWDGLRGLRKDNTGYDLKHLFIGSEGTLGVITAAVLTLFPAIRSRATAWVALPDPQAAVDLIGVLRATAGPRLTGCELMSAQSLEFVLRHVPGTRDPFTGAHPWYALVELSDPMADAGLDATLETALGAAFDRELLLDAVVAEGSARIAALWNLREGISEAQNQEGPSLKHDVTVPIGSIPAFVRETDEALRAAVPGIRIVTYGHVGDGNLHYNLSGPLDMEPDVFRARAEELARIVYDSTARFAGSISAEHGLGQSKRDLLADYKPAVEIELMRGVKRLLDPAGLMNPGKVLPAE
ncbi:malate dehydrogenase (quinone) [Actinoalloteichus sp. GBA129-24]|uniref:malate dehydrogenase (quinone) n=1 Tax=Actinoalloteichus sp. GBA129-24 TaxID=1612551 RepID=UPI000950A0E2|nr:malate dehydrogenase (quinone) [Actinoalloteichus sp. GBA129-24]APU19135.1 malate:quinone-oxidoreductase [Actinoalloteichus sp. GBA129-24]